jgi:NACHT domain
MYTWANSNDRRLIFWLNGLAGTGKSTIARTVAREYFEQGRLGASFFFSKGGGDVGHAGKFFTTIAVQLARRSQSLRRHICEAVNENSNIANQSLGDQWRQLILSPLRKLEVDRKPMSYIIVVDALDECDNDKDVRTTLQLLAEAGSLGIVRLRLLLTSRPEIPIRHGFHEMLDAEHQDFVLHNISPSIVDHDIFVFLKYELRSIGERRSLGAGWLSEETVKLLVQKASGLFIWAATACRFIEEGEKRRPIRSRLLAILGSYSLTITQSGPEEQLNEIYRTVLSYSIPEKYFMVEREELLSDLKMVVGSIVVLLSPLPVPSMARLLDIPTEDVDDCLDSLHAILNIPKDQARPIRLHHPSFRDFLLNPKRCTDERFQVDEKQAHQKLAARCVQLISDSLVDDICGVGIPGTLVSGVKESRIEQFLPLEVQYACLYWIQHLQKSNAQLRDNDYIHQFLQDHLLHWLEALSWMQKMSGGILEIISLESIVSVSLLIIKYRQLN